MQPPSQLPTNEIAAIRCLLMSAWGAMPQVAVPAEPRALHTAAKTDAVLSEGPRVKSAGGTRQAASPSDALPMLNTRQVAAEA
jgi:hypothetical protein